MPEKNVSVSNIICKEIFFVKRDIAAAKLPKDMLIEHKNIKNILLKFIFFIVLPLFSEIQ